MVSIITSFITWTAICFCVLFIVLAIGLMAIAYHINYKKEIIDDLKSLCLMSLLLSITMAVIHFGIYYTVVAVMWIAGFSTN